MENKIGISIILFSGAFFMIICLFCLFTLIYQMRTLKKRDEFYQKQIADIVNVIQDSSRGERELIKEIHELTQTLKK